MSSPPARPPGQPGPAAGGTVRAAAVRRAAGPGPAAGPEEPAAPAPPPRGSGGGGGWAAVLGRYAVVAVMGALGLWGLARDSSMGNDEVATRFAAGLSLHHLAHLLRHVDAVHGLYYLLMHGWLKLGTSPAVMRIPSVIAMTVAAGLLVVLTRRLTSSGWAPLFAGLVMALTPVISFYAQTARSYAMVFACVVGATLALVRVLQAEVAGDPLARVTAIRRWVAYAALVTLSGYLNELSLLVLAAHAVTLLLARCGRRVAFRWAVAVVGSAVLVAPLVILSAHQAGVVSWIARPGLADLHVLFRDYFGVNDVAGVLLAACAVCALLPSRRTRAAGSVPGSAWQAQHGVSLAAVALPLLVVPAGLLLLESLIAAQPLYVDRYVLYGEAGAAMLAGAGLFRIGRWLGDRVAWVPGLAVCLVTLLAQLAPQQQIRTPESRLFDFGGPARFVGANARPGDGVLYLSPFYRKAELGYPRDFQDVTDFALAVPPARAGNFQGGNKSPARTVTLMPRFRRIWVVGRSPQELLAAGPGGALPGELTDSRALEGHYTMTAEQKFRGITVTLWVRSRRILQP